mgnify:CR=1 FL=1
MDFGERLPDGFCPFPPVRIAGAGSGPLQGMTFAVKDLFDLAGHVTGGGNPMWLATHPPAETTAPAVTMLLNAGADLVGKTITDELAFSLLGHNAHYGSPLNPAAPARLTGGSSSGSAAVVAGCHVDTALGTDTGGSVRLPASCCGLLGFRPTHGRITRAGVMPLAPQFDAVGWFARSGEVLQQVGQVLLGQSGSGPAAGGGRRWAVLLVEDAFAELDAGTRSAFAPAVDALTAALGPPGDIALTPNGLESWAQVFRILQGRQIWQTYGGWITAHRPIFAPDVAERFAWTATLAEEAVRGAERIRAAILQQLHTLLQGDVLLCLPTVPGIAPLRQSSADERQTFRNRALSLLCIASLSGLPQVTLPLVELENCPLGLSLIAGPGRDEDLLAAAVQVMTYS